MSDEANKKAEVYLPPGPTEAEKQDSDYLLAMFLCPVDRTDPCFFCQQPVYIYARMWHVFGARNWPNDVTAVCDQCASGRAPMALLIRDFFSTLTSALAMRDFASKVVQQAEKLLAKVSAP